MNPRPLLITLLVLLLLAPAALAVWDALGAAEARPNHIAQQGAESSSPAAALQEEPDEDNPDVLLLALLTIGAAGGAAVLGLIGYLIRQRVGFWLHRPPDRSGEGPPEEHR